MVTAGDADRLRWPAAVGALLGGAACCALFAGAWHRGWWVPAPILLWWGVTLVLVAARICLTGTTYYTRAPRYGSARHLALLSAAVVGLWLGSQKEPAIALAFVPIAAGVVNQVGRRLPARSDYHATPSALLWNAWAVAGELLGYLIAICARHLQAR